MKEKRDEERDAGDVGVPGWGGEPRYNEVMLVYSMRERVELDEENCCWR